MILGLLYAVFRMYGIYNLLDKLRLTGLNAPSLLNYARL